MPGVVQRVPMALLDLLGLKSTGQNPVLFSELLGPSIDMTDLYLANRWEIINASVAAIATTGLKTTGSWEPADGTVLVIDGACIQFATVLAAATTYRLRLCLYTVQTGNPFRMAPSAVTTTVGEIVAGAWDGPIVVRPGEGLGIWAENVTLGTSAAPRIAGRVARLGI